MAPVSYVRNCVTYINLKDLVPFSFDNYTRVHNFKVRLYEPTNVTTR